MKLKEINVEIPLPRSLVDPIFGDHASVPIDKTESDPELAGANEELDQMNREIRDKEGLDVKRWKDVI